MNGIASSLRWLLALCTAVLLSACGSAGPPPDEVREALQQQLDSALGGNVLAIKRFRPAGGAPLEAPDGRLVYFNAALELTRDYDFTRWDTHSVASLAALLGAGPRGVYGLAAGGNRAGDEIGVYGSAAFARTASGWRLVPRAPAESDAAPAPEPAGTVAAVQPRAKELPPPSPVEAALGELSSLLAQAPGPAVSPHERDAIVLEETERALREVRQRLNRAAAELVLAAGPAGGAYEEIGTALQARAHEAGTGFRGAMSEGSVGNVRMLRDRAAQFALVQNDLAKSAWLGRGRFAGAPQQDLRAVASLFPEAIHLVAASDAAIASVADLRGKRVNLGPEGSGTRANAAAILEAHGVPLDALAQVATHSLPDAATALAQGRLDALFATVHAPARALQRLASASRVEFVPLGPGAELVASGLVPLNLPARTYPGQASPVPTLAATALLVTREDVSDSQIDTMLELVFDRRVGTATAAVSRIGVATARTGVTIPWHERADANLVGRGATARR
jgi:TRAP transporter TAXI family solute receptor